MSSDFRAPQTTGAESSAPDQHAGIHTDPHLWLEDVEGEAALDWVRERNAHSEGLLLTDREREIEASVLEVLDSDERIPGVVQRGEHLYNFWTDEEHPRGLWRRTTWESFRTDSPEWEILIDVDALGAEEGVNWVWHGAQVLYPSRERALVSLSRGGSDADVTREFDLTTLTFVDDGFTREESKGGMSWADTTGDAVLIYTDFGEGSMTRSGYPRTVRRWRRGTPLADAEVLYEGLDDDMYIAAGFDHTPGFERTFVVRTLAFYREETFELRDGELLKIDVPISADASVWREWLLIRLRDDWDVDGATYRAGSLLAAPYDAYMTGDRSLTVLFSPSATTSLANVTATRSRVVVTLLDDVVNRLEALTPPDRPDRGADDDGGWRRSDLDLASAAGAIGDFPTLGVGAVDPIESDQLWLSTQGFLAPSALSLLDVEDDGAMRVETLKSLPSFFDADGMEVSQHFATSEDGTRVPYFQVTPAGFEEGSSTPTLISAYGGFEIALLPSYSPVMARAWVARGGVFVLANLRGGGEYGPAWHQAALQEKRHRAYEDCAAVARDLVERGVTKRENLGIHGRSNGGLLVGNMLTQYPELFGAIVCGVPLLDMKRYSHLLAGASWMAEYGDPDDPTQWEFIQGFSPYHLVREDVDYPPVFFYTSTRDDRVHPGHARKMAERMREWGKDVVYWENIEGGHGGAATNEQSARIQGLIHEFLWQRLGG